MLTISEMHCKEKNSHSSVLVTIQERIHYMIHFVVSEVKRIVSSYS